MRRLLISIGPFWRGASLIEKAALVLATGFGAGLVRVAPGTVGTLFPGIPVVWAVGHLGWPAAAALVSGLGLLSVWVCGAAARRLGRPDPPCVVIDEVVGLCVALFAVSPTPLALATGFALFRLFDILKPWPVRWIDRNIRGGQGILLDDVVAGLLARAGVEALWRMGWL